MDNTEKLATYGIRYTIQRKIKQKHSTIYVRQISSNNAKTNRTSDFVIVAEIIIYFRQCNIYLKIIGMFRYFEQCFEIS